MDILPSGTEINGFRIVDKIANGNMGMVYRAIQINLNREVALKVLFPQTTEDEDFVRGFFREAQAAAAFTHQHIVQAYDVGKTDDGLYYFAMELVDGGDIQEKIKAQGALNATDALSMLIGIADGLHHGNTTRQLTHSDLKPANILLTKHGVAKLADLGLARMGGEIQGESDGIMLTPLYAAPEMINETWKVGDPRADIYSFGATLYEMIIGTPPFKDTDYNKILDMHLHSKHVSLTVLNPDIPKAISAFVDSLLEKQPENRPQDWITVKKAMDKLLRAPKAQLKKKKVFHVNSANHHHKEQKKSPKALVIILALLIAAGAFLVFVLPNKKAAPKEIIKTPVKQESIDPSPTDDIAPPPKIKPKKAAPKEIVKIQKVVEPKIDSPEEILYKEKLKGLINSNLMDWQENAEALSISAPENKVRFFENLSAALDNAIEHLVNTPLKERAELHLVSNTENEFTFHQQRVFGTVEFSVKKDTPKALEYLSINLGKIIKRNPKEDRGLSRLTLMLNARNPNRTKSQLSLIKKPMIKEIINDILEVSK